MSVPQRITATRKGQNLTRATRAAWAASCAAWAPLWRCFPAAQGAAYTLGKCPVIQCRTRNRKVGPPVMGGVRFGCQSRRKAAPAIRQPRGCAVQPHPRVWARAIPSTWEVTPPS
jgi:hypothetical protein